MNYGYTSVLGGHLTSLKNKKQKTFLRYFSAFVKHVNMFSCTRLLVFVLQVSTWTSSSFNVNMGFILTCLVFMGSLDWFCILDFKDFCTSTYKITESA